MGWWSCWVYLGMEDKGVCEGVYGREIGVCFLLG